MRKVFVRRFFVIVVFLAVGSAFLALRSFGQAQNRASTSDDSLDTFMQKYLEPPRPGFDEGFTRRYVSASVDLKDDGTHQIIVYAVDSCGSGGCTTLLLAPENSSFRIVTKFTIVRLPIRVLATKSNGWHDLGVGLHGGGIQPGYEAKLSFNGKTYPRNPSMPPARRLTRKVAGTVVISSEMVQKLVKKDSVPIHDDNHPER